MAYTIRKFKHVTLHTKGRGRVCVSGGLVTSEDPKLFHLPALPFLSVFLALLVAFGHITFKCDKLHREKETVSSCGGRLP